MPTYHITATETATYSIDAPDLDTAIERVRRQQVDADTRHVIRLRGEPDPERRIADLERRVSTLERKRRRDIEPDLR